MAVFSLRVRWDCKVELYTSILVVMNELLCLHLSEDLIKWVFFMSIILNLGLNKLFTYDNLKISKKGQQ